MMEKKGRSCSGLRTNCNKAERFLADIDSLYARDAQLDNCPLFLYSLNKLMCLIKVFSAMGFERKPGGMDFYTVTNLKFQN